MSKKVLVISGDGIGPDITTETRKVLDVVNTRFNLAIEFDEALLGGAAVDVAGVPMPDETLRKAENSDAIFFAAIGGPGIMSAVICVPKKAYCNCAPHCSYLAIYVLPFCIRN